MTSTTRRRWILAGALLLTAFLVGLLTPPCCQASAAPLAAPTAAVQAPTGWKGRTVYVRSAASHQWRVNHVAELIDNGSPLNLIVQRPGADKIGCLDYWHRQCFLVISADVPQDEGVRNWRNEHRQIVESMIQLDDSEGRTMTRRARDARLCRQIGLGVGLPTNDRVASCMSGQGAPTLDAADYRLLRKLY